MGNLSFLSGLCLTTDETAMRQVKSRGDQAAFRRLVKRWEKPILRLCMRMIGDVHRAEDLKQEAFARIFVRRKDFREGCRFSTWLWRITLNLCYDELRKRDRRGEYCVEDISQLLEAENSGSEQPAPNELAAANEESEIVRWALLQLSEKHRAAVVLRYCEGLKLCQVAEILEIPTTTAASRIAVALSQLGRVLGPKMQDRPQDSI